MYVGHQHTGERWMDATEQFGERVNIDGNVCGAFRVSDGLYSIWIKEK